MIDTASYILSAYSFIYNQPFERILDTGYQSKNGNPIPSFDEDLLIQLCSDAQLVFEKEENILKVNGDLIIVGDIHGSLHDLLRILYFIINCKNTKVLFLGDYVDRGNFSIECITLLFAFKIVYPERFYLIRGNHEFETMCSQYGFKKEILNYHNPKRNCKVEAKSSNFLKKYYEEQKEIQCDEYYANHNDANCYKYSEKLYESFIQVFSYLPICCIVNENTFCVHGGLTPRLNKIEQLKTSIIRPINKYEDSNLFTDILWSDPSLSTSSLFSENPRGHGFLFNTNAVDMFLMTNKFKRIIRGHQCIKNGTETKFNDKCITVFSASSYGREMENNSGILKINHNDRIEYIIFPPLKRLQKIDAFYYKVQNFNANNVKKNQSCFSIKHPNLTSDVSSRIRQFRGIKPNHSYLAISRLSNLMFTTNSRKSNLLVIKKPLVSNSTSMTNLNFEDENINYSNENNEDILPIDKSVC